MKSFQTETTIKIDNVLYDICKKKKIRLQLLIKQTYHFLLSIHIEFTNDDLSAILLQIFQRYDNSTHKPLSKSYKTIKTSLTEQQSIAYKKIDRDKRIEYFNKLICKHQVNPILKSKQV